MVATVCNRRPLEGKYVKSSLPEHKCSDSIVWISYTFIRDGHVHCAIQIEYVYCMHTKLIVLPVFFMICLSHKLCVRLFWRMLNVQFFLQSFCFYVSSVTHVSISSTPMQYSDGKKRIMSFISNVFFSFISTYSVD